MDPHLEHIPGFAAFTIGRLPCRNLQALSWQTDGSLNAEILGLGALDQFLADFFKGGNLSRGKRDANLMDLGPIAEVLFRLGVGHDCGVPKVWQECY